jgi:cyanophycinase-like exopeptidase
MTGPVALVGGGEFLPSLAEFDHGLLAATGRRRPRVAILPTAAYPAGQAAFERVAATALEHYRGLGAEVEALGVRDRASADDASHVQAIGEADVVVLCGGDAGYVRSALRGSGVWAAIEAANGRGAIVVGCAAGAAALGGRQLDVGVRLGRPMRWAAALAGVPDAVILADYDARPEPVMALMAMLSPGAMPVVGIDRETAVIGRNGSWAVHGIGRVTVWHGRRRERHRRGEAFRLDPDEPAERSTRI